MYLSRIELNSARRKTRQYLLSPQVVHAAVMAGFTRVEHEQSGSRVLWRMDSTNQSQSPVLYVVSPHEPDFTHICEQVGWPSKPYWESCSYRPLLDQLETGQDWQFRVAMNPVKQIRDPATGVKKRVPHLTLGQQELWFLSKAEQHGFSIGKSRELPESPQLKVAESRRYDFGRNTEFKGQNVTLAKTTFDGVLTISDAGVFRSALVDGIGRAKGYGCGLLTLAGRPTTVVR